MSKNFGRVLRYCRSLGGKSQLELALDAGVSARHLSFLESGRAEPGRDVVAKLAAALEISDTARNALFAAAGFSSALNCEPKAPGRLLLLEQMILNWDPHPSALTDSEGCIMSTNVSMRALHETLTATVSALPGLSAAELALGPIGFGPHLKNREALERRYAQCRVLEQLMAGAAVDHLPSQKDVLPSAAEMQFEGAFGALSFELVEAMAGHPLHGPKHAVRIYSMVPSNRETEAAVSAMVARHKSANAPDRHGRRRNGML